MQLPKCDKCGGIEFEEEREEIEYISASEYYKQHPEGYVPWVEVYGIRLMECKKCGAKYSRERYSYADSLGKAC